MGLNTNRLVAIKTYLDWQSVFGEGHLRCPNAQVHVNGDQHPSAFVYEDGIFCFGCGWHTDDIIEACRVFRGWQPSKTIREIYHHLVRNPPRLRKDVRDTPFPIEPIERWASRLTAQDVSFIQRTWGTTPHIQRAALLGHTGDSFAIPHVGLDDQVWAVKFRRDDRIRTTGPKYWAARACSLKYLYPSFVVKSYLSVGLPRELFLCEGEFDALAALSYGYPAVALPSGVATRLDKWPELWTRLSGNVSLRIAFDNDNAGNAAACVAFEYFSEAYPDLETQRVELPKDQDVASFLLAGGIL